MDAQLQHAVLEFHALRARDLLHVCYVKNIQNDYIGLKTC